MLEEVINHIPDNKIVIADAKRGNISSTAEHYKKTFFENFDVDAINLNPLMGFETLESFAKYEEKGMKERSFYLSLYNIPVKAFTKHHPDFEVNAEDVTILRSVFMKPEHEGFVEELFNRIENCC